MRKRFGRAARSRRVVAVVIVFALVAGGCATTPRFDVSVDALARSSAESIVEGDARYLLLPMDAASDSRDLQFQEFARVLEFALGTQGFDRVNDVAHADVVLLVDYGVENPETRTVMLPRPAFGYASGWGYAGHVHGVGCGHGFHGHRHSAFPYYPYDYPYFGRADLFPSVRSYTTFNRFFTLEARAIESISDPRAGPPVWRTHVESRGASDDLRRVFPVLVGAARDYFGRDTDERIETTIAEDDPRIPRISGPIDLPSQESSGEIEIDPAEAPFATASES